MGANERRWATGSRSLRAGVKGVHRKLDFFAIAVEERPEELQAAGESKEGVLQAGGGETDPGGPAAELPAVGERNSTAA